METVKRIFLILNSLIVITAATCFAILMVIVLSGFGLVDKQTEYKLDNANITFSLPKAWEVVSTDDNGIYFNKNSANMEVSVYKKWELHSGNPTDLLDEKINEILATANDYTLVQDFGEDKVIDRVIYSKLYSIEVDGRQTQYYFSVMEFVDSETFVYTLYETKESHMKYHMSDINRMLIRMKWNGEEIDLVMN